MLNFNQKLADALRLKDKARINVFRALLTERSKFQTAANAKEYTDADELNIIKSLIKQHNESIDNYVKYSRFNLAEDERKELHVLQELIPKPVDKDTLTKALIEICTEKNIPADPYLKTPMISKKDMADVIRYIKNKYPQNEGREIAEFVKVFVQK